MKTVTLEELHGLIGQTVGVSDWLAIEQERIDRFADVTEDHQFIHIDPVAAAKTPFGGTIAHGFLSLSMLSRLAETADMPMLKGIVMGINYGFNKVRFVQPVLSGRSVRTSFMLKSVDEGKGGRYTLAWDVIVGIEGEEKPALVAEWLTMQVVQPA